MRKIIPVLIFLFVTAQSARAGIFDDRQRYSEIPFLMFKMLNLPSTGTAGAIIKPSPGAASPTPNPAVAGSPTPGAGQRATVNGQGITGQAVFEPTAATPYQLQLQFTINRDIADDRQVIVWLNKGTEYIRGPSLSGPITAGSPAQGELRDVVNRIDHTVVITDEPKSLPVAATAPTGQSLFSVPQQVIPSGATATVEKPSIFQRILTSLQNLF